MLKPYIPILVLALLGLGLLLALIVGGLLARRMVVPIRRLQQGAERLGAGDLSQRLDIRTGDEIETLATMQPSQYRTFPRRAAIAVIRCYSLASDHQCCDVV